MRERQQLADGLAKYLAMLGLEKQSREVTLTDYVQQHYGEKDSGKTQPAISGNGSSKGRVVCEPQENPEQDSSESQDEAADRVKVP